MSDSKPDLSTLAGYVRNSIKQGKVAEFTCLGTTFYVVEVGGPALLITTTVGESVVLRHDSVASVTTLLAGRFSLRRAAFVCRLIDALRGKIGTQRSGQKNG
jgi:hypothetical protein